MSLLAFWSPKGGSGTSVTAAACAIQAARRAGPVRLVDLRGDQPAVLGLGTEPETGVADWLAAGPTAPTDALDRLGVEIVPGLSLLPRGRLASVLEPAAAAEAGAALAVALRDGPLTIVDVGVPDSPVARAVLEVSDASLLVVRECYLALRRAAASSLTARAFGLVVLQEPGRALGPADVAQVLGRPVTVRVPVRVAVARAVDAGVLPTRLPEPLTRAADQILRELGLAGSGRRMTRPPGAIDGAHDHTLRATVHRRLLASDGAEALVGVAPAELRARIAALLALEDPLVGVERRARLVDAVFDDVVGLGALEPLLLDPTIDEIMVNGSGRCFVERAGAIVPVPLLLDDAGIVRLAQRILAPLALRLDRSSPMVDARLPDGSRLHAVIPPLAIDGPCLTIRRFGAKALSLDAFGVDGAAAAALQALVAGGANVVVSGGTGSGKTTLLNVAGFLGADERIITIEETAELRLPQPHVVRLEARPANAEGAGAVGVRELVRAALRMRPDRLVVGEVRGAEALDLLQALNTGHDGSMSTVHANGPLDALRRLSTLALFGGTGLPHDAVCEQLRASVDVVVQVARAAGGAREVVAVMEVVDAPGPFTVRPLLVRTPAGLRVAGRPERGGRRGEVR